jgi:hypothetical protein
MYFILENCQEKILSALTTKRNEKYVRWCIYYLNLVIVYTLFICQLKSEINLNKKWSSQISSMEVHETK